MSGAPPKKGMSSGTKVLLILGIIAGGGLLLCCGGFAWFGYQMAPRVTQVPAEVSAKSKEVLDMEISEEDWEPKLSLEMSIPMIMDMHMISWQSKKDDGGMAITKVMLKVKDENQSQEQLDAQMEQSFSQQGGGQEGAPMPQLINVNSEEVKLTVLGTETPFQLVTGNRPGDSETEWKEIKGHLRDGDEIIVLRLQLKSENFDMEQIKAMLENAS